MTTHSKIVISCGALIVAMVAGRVPLHPQQSRMRRSRGFGGPSRSSCRACRERRSHVQARGDARHLPRPALQPGRGPCRTAAAAPRGNPATASADEIRAVWGPFVAEAGTFELSGNDTDHDASDGGEESRGDARRRDERLYLPARGRPVDADPGPHACRSESHIRSRSRSHASSDIRSHQRRSGHDFITARVLARRPRASRRRDLSWRHADASQ